MATGGSPLLIFSTRVQEKMRGLFAPERPAENPAALEGKRLAVYEIVSARRDTYETSLWQVPALSLTAQAFLFTIALGAGSSIPARRIAAVLSFVSSVASMQLLAKHRHFEETDSRLCEKLEGDLGLQEICGYLPHSGMRNRRNRNDPKVKGWIAYSSFKLWRLMLGVFALAAVFTIALSFTGALE
jgi:hypothetical protein